MYLKIAFPIGENGQKGGFGEKSAPFRWWI